ncbi:MAG: transporter substrate-binding domain-containing protein [Candidatus Buchananbacteria bacterium]|nr:transporter substrate-binding domain-containing protein [Candidatus Buchananbacteria bacterium]
MKDGNWAKIVGIVILTVVVSLLTVKFSGSSLTNSNEKSVYDRVVSSGTIRACYTAFPPALIKDPNTGELSGIFFETLNKAAQNMGLKVEWNTEVGWGDAIEALNSGKCDIVGSDSWSNSTRGKSAEFIQPLYYSAINAYVRANDNRFNNDVLVANNPNYTLATLDGETAQVIAAQNFPKAKTIQLPQLSDVSQLFVNVADGKADMTFQDTATANLYMKSNPGKIKNVSTQKPIVVYGDVMMVKKGEFTFKSSIDNAIIELLNNGYIDSVISRYESGGIYRVATPYVTQ